MAPWADAVFAMDRAWWREYGNDVVDGFAGDKYCINKNAGPSTFVPMIRAGNSGASAIVLAVKFGALRVILLGVDCKAASSGKRHFHGNHRGSLGQAGSMPKWPAHFADVRRAFPKVEIINCSRDTALKCFPVLPLEDVL